MRNSFGRNLDYDLWVFLAHTREVMLKARKKELAQYNIQSRHAAVLYVLHAIGENMTLTEISRCLARERHSVFELLKRMEKKGLLRKTKDTDGKRQVRVVLTEKGREACRQIVKQDTIHNIMSALSETKRKQLISCLQVLVKASLKELENEPDIVYPVFSPSKQ